MKSFHHKSSCVVLSLILLANHLAAQAPQRNGDNNGVNASERGGPNGLPTQLDFQTDLFTGRFGYQVPFELAPGRHDHAPSVGLVYGSGNANGWCGVGWNLDLGFIQRETKYGVPVQWNNGLPVAAYDDTKGFVFSLNGQASPLVSVTNNEYRAQIQGAFLRFLFQTNNNQWLVFDKSGNQYSFGTNSASRMSNYKTGWPSNSWNGTYRWGISHEQTVLGDTVDYTYTNNSGMLYPSQLSYNGHTNGLSNTNTLDFILESRSDVTISFISGYGVQQSQRLSALVHKVSGQVVWSNHLAYAQSSSTTRSLLQSVTRYGTNLTSSLPPITFNYSVQSFGFQPVTNWTNVSIPSGGNTYNGFGDWTVPVSPGPDGEVADLVDMDGDGLPDRVFVPLPTGASPMTNFWVQHNNGSGFDNPVAFGPLSVQYHTNPTFNDANNVLWDSLDGQYGRLLDINGDGFPDRVVDPIESLYQNPDYTYTYNRLAVQLNNGANFTSSSDVNWTNVVSTNSASGAPAQSVWRAIESTVTSATLGVPTNQVMMIDMNGDGLPDRIMSRLWADDAPYHTNFTNYWVQFNTGSGFTGTNVFSFVPYDKEYEEGFYGRNLNSDQVRMIDINGDGLPDRVMYPINTITQSPEANCSNVTFYVVEYNNGYGFEPPVAFGGVLGQYLNAPCNSQYICSSALQDSPTNAFRDINGDGLPDLIVLYQQCGVSTNWFVQLNQGTNFSVPYLYGPNASQGHTSISGDLDYWAIQGVLGRLIDINGDGIPDHVMPGYPVDSQNYFAVELGKGPFPDLLTVVSNGMGGSASMTYKPSTAYDNRQFTNSATSRRLLPFPVYTVSSVSINDGINPSGTTSYNYSGGFWNPVLREFDGFATTTEVDPLGTTNIHWFHQAGGRDNSAFGEYQDTTNSLGKKGMEFRVDTIGSDGNPYKLTLYKVDETVLMGGQHFAFVSQTLGLDYPASASNYRAVAQQFGYDTTTGNLTNKTDFGEVGSVVVNGQTFTDVPGDTVYQSITFASLANTNILDAPQRSILTTDSAGSNILRETLYTHDGNTGNLLQQQDRMCPTCYVTNSYFYDSYNNRTIETNQAGIVTTTVYDSTYQMLPTQQTEGGTFTSTFSYDARSGKLLTSTDAKGLVKANSYDPFFRLMETDVSTTPNGTPNEWLARFSYRLAAAGGGISTNVIHVQRSDGVDPTNGHETWTYSDGLGRVLQVRNESETNGFRATDTVYDKRGNVQFNSEPYFSSGTNFTKPTSAELGSLNGFDPIGRLASVTAGVNGSFNSSGQLTSTTPTGGDIGSPLAAATTGYRNGTDPWTLVNTDEAGEIHRYSLDAYGRTNQIVEATSTTNFTTLLAYDLAGDLTNITDNANNQIQYAYNNLGQLAAMADPDMGVWQYERDFAGRLRDQIDADNQRIQFNYDDPIGRLRTRQVYDYTGALVYGVTNVYDISDDGNFTVYAGQLYKTIDSQGNTKKSYDVRGRVLKTARFLTKNSNTYTSQFSYDDQDRVTQEIYPNSGPTITNIYDTGANLSQVKQVGGGNTVFYAAKGFNALGQLTGINFGNGVASASTYFANSHRLNRVTTAKSGGTNIQDLTYTYDQVADLKSIVDGVYTGTNSAALSSIIYDDLHRLTSLTRPAISQTTTFGYDSVGNISANGENGGGAYNYGIRMPHAVKSANGTNYAYDANGNMLVRGSQRLAYDPENRLAYVVTSNSYATFGYDAGGSRLWKQSSGTNGLQVWIGGDYEEKNGEILYHISAAGRLVCTFDSTGANVFAYYHPDNLGSTAIETDPNGNKIQHYEYKAYGQDRLTESASAFPVSRRFTAQVKDEETGLYYYNARYYDPQLARFIQADDVIPNFGNPQSYDRYAYCFNNPLRYTDPSGHFAFLVPALWAGGSALTIYAADHLYWSAQIAAHQVAASDAMDRMVESHGYINYAHWLAEHQPKNAQSGSREQIQAMGALGVAGADAVMTAGTAIVPEIKAGQVVGEGTSLLKGVTREEKLFRGVPGNETEKALLGRQGIAKPRGTALDEATLTAHVKGEDANAGVTSWTTDRNVAKTFSGSDGTIIEVNKSSVANSVVPRPPVPKYGSEKEILLKGTIHGTPTKP